MFKRFFCKHQNESVGLERKIKLTTPGSSESGWIVYARNKRYCRDCNRVSKTKWRVLEIHEYGTAGKLPVEG